MRRIATFVLICVLIFTFSSAVQGNDAEVYDYYWRDYTGILPNDAVPGGVDKNKGTLYIGQVYITLEDGTTGVFPVALYNRTTSVTVEFSGVQKRNQFLKILCSSNYENFKWLKVNKAFREVTSGQNLVPGGSYVDDSGSYVPYIGRVKCGESLDIGRILEWRAYSFETILYTVCNDAGKETKIDYEVLIYKPTPNVSSK